MISFSFALFCFHFLVLLFSSCFLFSFLTLFSILVFACFASSSSSWPWFPQSILLHHDYRMSETVMVTVIVGFSLVAVSLSLFLHPSLQGVPFPVAVTDHWVPKQRCKPEFWLPSCSWLCVFLCLLFSVCSLCGRTLSLMSQWLSRIQVSSRAGIISTASSASVHCRSSHLVSSHLEFISSHLLSSQCELFRGLRFHSSPAHRHFSNHIPSLSRSAPPSLSYSCFLFHQATTASQTVPSSEVWWLRQCSSIASSQISS